MGNMNQMPGAGAVSTAPTAPSTAPNVFDQSAGAYNQALGIAQGAPGLRQGMQGFQNPYQQQVIDNTITDMGRVHDLTQRQIGDQAASSSAFGGDRHGIQAGLANSEFQKNVGDFTSSMNRQGFMDSAALAGQDFQQGAQQVSALGNLSQQGFNYGRQLNQDQYGMGQNAQNLQQAIMNATGAQFDANNPMAWIQQITGAMNQNPLGVNSVTSGTDGYNPSTGEKIMTGVGMASQFAGMPSMKK